MNEIQKRKSAKKLKLLLLIPLFLVSFAGVFYLAITAGNKLSTNSSSQDSTRKAFNSKLPAANLKDAEKNKLEIYMEAQQDSVRRKEAMDKDPYEKGLFNADAADGKKEKPLPQPNTLKISAPVFGNVDNNEKKVSDRLEKLYSALNKNTEVTKSPQAQPAFPENLSAADSQSDGDLEKLLASVQGNDSAGDPEMKRIEEVLDKVLDIQHPERIRERTQQKNPGQVPSLAVTTVPALTDTNAVTLASIDLDKLETSVNRFYGLEEDILESGDHDSSTILAVIHGDQLIHDGGKARLRLLQNIFVGKILVPKDNFIYGICSIGNERVNIHIDNITVGNNIYPIHLMAFGSDGMEGIDVPGAIGQQAGKEGLNQALQNIELFNADPSIGTQAAAASVQTVKSLMSRKVRQVSATLKSGQTVLLKNN
jgi:conjugative transposon TraM protein